MRSVDEDRKIFLTIRKRKDRWLRNVLRSNSIQETITEENIKEKGDDGNTGWSEEWSEI